MNHQNVKNRKKKTTNFILFFKLTICWILGLQLSVKGQIKADKTLPTNSSINVQGSTWIIQGGTQSGNNLFHSFSEFSIPTGSSATFNNNSQIQNIIARVTGPLPSIINGPINANSLANLFFLNPNGISLGANSKINIGGSFIGSTATSLIFTDGSSFNSNGQQQPALSINVPYGLSFDKNSNSIKVEGTGNTYSVANPIFAPMIGAGSGTGLGLNPGKSFTLIGNGLTLEGAQINADIINLESIKNGLVTFNQEWKFDNSNVNEFNDIQVLNQSSIDASGSGIGSISLSGNIINIFDGSVAVIQNQGEQSNVGVNILAKNSLNLDGTTPSLLPSRIVTETVGPNKAGDITIVSPTVSVTNGADITSRTYGDGKSGNINIQADKSINVEGYSSIDNTLFSFILTGTASSANAGDINFSTSSLDAGTGGEVGSGTLGDGNSGNVNIIADTINVTNSAPSGFGSAVYTISGSKGNSGNLNLFANDTINVGAGGFVTAGTEAEGNSGNANITALKEINLSGVNPYFTQGASQITSSSSQEIVPIIKSVFNLPPQTSGLPGNLTINTSILKINSQAFLSVGNSGTNGAGTNSLTINADNIHLKDASIGSSSIPGGGGDIIINSKTASLFNSIISANSGPEKGGNIDFNTSLLILLNKSQIKANSRNNFGGQININAYGLIKSNNSTFSSSSALGPQFNGLVNINAPNFYILPSKISSPINNKVAKLSKVCQSSSLKTRSEFIIAGKSGIERKPDELETSNEEIDNNNKILMSKKSVINTVSRTIPAIGFKQIENGKMEMTTSLDNRNTIPTEHCDEN